jgi:hypothetical protein
MKSFTCPHCHGHIGFEMADVGQTGTCPHCGHLATVRPGVTHWGPLQRAFSFTATILCIATAAFVLNGIHMLRNESDVERGLLIQMAQLRTNFIEPMEVHENIYRKLLSEAISNKDYATIRIVRPPFQETVEELEPYRDRWRQMYDLSVELNAGRKATGKKCFLGAGICVGVGLLLYGLTRLRLPGFTVTVSYKKPT